MRKNRYKGQKINHNSQPKTDNNSKAKEPKPQQIFDEDRAIRTVQDAIKAMPADVIKGLQIYFKKHFIDWRNKHIADYLSSRNLIDQNVLKQALDHLEANTGDLDAILKQKGYIAKEVDCVPSFLWQAKMADFIKHAKQWANDEFRYKLEYIEKKFRIEASKQANSCLNNTYYQTIRPGLIVSMYC